MTLFRLNVTIRSRSREQRSRWPFTHTPPDAKRSCVSPTSSAIGQAPLRVRTLVSGPSWPTRCGGDSSSKHIVSPGRCARSAITASCRLGETSTRSGVWTRDPAERHARTWRWVPLRLERPAGVGACLEDPHRLEGNVGEPAKGVAIRSGTRRTGPFADSNGLGHQTPGLRS